MDTIPNKLAKDKITDILEELLEGVEETEDSVDHCHILITQAVGKARLWLHIEKKDSIIKSFKQVGISLFLDGTGDAKLYVRGLPDIAVGQW